MARFLSGHEVFDEVVSLDYGSSILMLDDSLTETRYFLSALFGQPRLTQSFDVAEITSRKAFFPGEALVLAEQPLVYVSASINDFRRKHRRAVLIHNYLSDFLIQYDPQEVLRFLEVSQKDIVENETVEFYALSRGTYPDVERKLGSILDGMIELLVNQENHFLTPIRCCKPDYHRKSFEYIINSNRLLIKWGVEFTDHLSVRGESEIKGRMKYLSENRHYLLIVRGPRDVPESEPIRGKLLLSQVLGRNLDHVLTLFQEKQEGLLRQLANWHVEGYIDLAKTSSAKIPAVKKKLSWRTRFLLALPSSIAAKMVSMKGLNRSLIPAEAYLVRRKSDEAFYSLLFPSMRKEPSVSLESIEEFLQDISTRVVTYDVIERLGEDPRNSLDLQFLPKIITIMLRAGYSVKPKIKAINQNHFQARLTSCPVCYQLKSDKPSCQSLTGAIIGNASVCFKQELSCTETQCIAKGDDACVFDIVLKGGQ